MKAYLITLEKIEIFDKYGGVIDLLLLTGSDEEKMLFDDNDWSILNGFYQDIELIRKGLAARTYFDEVVARMKSHCDQDSFDRLTAQFDYMDF